MTRKYIEHVYQHGFGADTSVKEVVPGADPYDLMADGYRFFEIEEVVDPRSGEVLRGKRKNYTGWIYRGERLTVEDVREKYPDKHILIDNMTSNKFDVVRTRGGAHWPLHDGDIVIGESW